MIKIDNLRIENVEGWSRLVADIHSDIKRRDNESTIWIAVEEENQYMLTDDVYNAFLILPVYMAMYYNTDLYIDGLVSKNLYRNVVDYIQPILCSFSDSLHLINVHVNGFKEADVGEKKINATGFSCGVDNLSTIYKYYIKEMDNDYKLNSLFMLNCGWHGAYGSERTIEIFKARYKRNKSAADALGLPVYMVDSNLHAFLGFLDDQASYFAIHTCVFALEKVISKYYFSSGDSYGELMKYGDHCRNLDFAGYGDAMMVPLLHSGNLSLILDGCQYRRTDKVEIISSWEIAQKYLNVCCVNDNSENCSVCSKCIRTLLPIEALGLLDSYGDVFDLDKYKKIAYEEKCNLVKYNGKHVFATENHDLFKSKGKMLPSRLESYIYLHFLKLKNFLSIK